MKPELKEKYRKDGSIWFREWRLNGKLHRKDDPVRIWYYKDGSIKAKQWYYFEKLHREDGPAEIAYNGDGSIDFQEWYLSGKELHKEDFTSLEMIKKMKAYPLFTIKEIAKMKLNES